MVTKDPSPARTIGDLVVTGVDSNRFGFRPGNITRIFMKNFVTFSEKSFSPGPRMNLVVGPNGSGKSTIVSAICVVLGNNLKVLGRSSDLGSYVKFGHNEASVEVWLYEPKDRKGYVSVRRQFNTDGRSQFFLNGARAKQSDIHHRIVQRYDIQIENLSQFMPQERIAEFTNCSPAEMLEIAVRSLGGKEKDEEIRNLADEDKRARQSSSEMTQKEAQLTKLQEQQENDAAAVEAFHKQEEIRERMRLIKVYIEHLRVDELKDKYRNIKDQLKRVTSEISETQASLNATHSGPLNAYKQSFEAAKQAYGSAKATASHLEQVSSDGISDCERLTMKSASTAHSLADVESSTRKLEDSLQQKRKDLETIASAYEDSAKNRGDLQGRIDSLNQDRTMFRSQQATARSEKGPFNQTVERADREIRFNEQSLRGLSDHRQQRLASLGRGQEGQYLIKCAELIDDLRGSNAFQGVVFGPVATELEVQEPYHAIVLESAVSGFLRTAFVTESGRDSKVLLGEWKKRFSRGWKPDIISAPTTVDDELDERAIAAQVPTRPIDDRLRALGISTTVDKIYKAPRAVRAALNAHAALHNIHVGGELSSQNQEALRFERGMFAWYTPEARCSVSGSRYDDKVRNLRVDSIAGISGQLFQGRLDEVEQQRQGYERAIEHAGARKQDALNSLNKLAEKDRQLESAVRAKEEEMRTLQSTRVKLNSMKSKVEENERAVKDLENTLASRNDSRLKAGIRNKLQKLEDEAVHKLSATVGKLGKFQLALANLDELMSDRIAASRGLSAEKAKHASVLEKMKELKESCEEMNNTRESLKEQLRQAKQNKPISDEDFRNNENLFCEELAGKNPEELHEEVAALEGQVLGLSTGGRSVVDNYQHRQNKIDKLQTEVEALRVVHERKFEDIRRRKEAFLSWLNTAIPKMRERFSGLYSRLGCLGDIQLTNQDSNSLADLSLEVLVSYREDAELRPISSTANSGGEKMCCTMIFAFSLLLQEERVPPFMVVDELNQGLDPVNEEKIMAMMMEDAEKPHSPQTFVITPKLLSDLELSPSTTAHIIFNGPVKGKSPGVCDPIVT